MASSVVRIGEGDASVTVDPTPIPNVNSANPIRTIHRTMRIVTHVRLDTFR